MDVWNPCKLMTPLKIVLVLQLVMALTLHLFIYMNRKVDTICVVSSVDIFEGILSMKLFL